MVLAKDVTVNRTGNSLRHAVAGKLLSSCVWVLLGIPNALPEDA